MAHKSDFHQLFFIQALWVIQDGPPIDDQAYFSFVALDFIASQISIRAAGHHEVQIFFFFSIMGDQGSEGTHDTGGCHAGDFNFSADDMVNFFHIRGNDFCLAVDLEFSSPVMGFQQAEQITVFQNAIGVVGNTETLARGDGPPVWIPSLLCP